MCLILSIGRSSEVGVEVLQVERSLGNSVTTLLQKDHWILTDLYRRCLQAD